MGVDVGDNVVGVDVGVDVVGVLVGAGVGARVGLGHRQAQPWLDTVFCGFRHGLELESAVLRYQ